MEKPPRQGLVRAELCLRPLGLGEQQNPTLRNERVPFQTYYADLL